MIKTGEFTHQLRILGIFEYSQLLLAVVWFGGYTWACEHWDAHAPGEEYLTNCPATQQSDDCVRRRNCWWLLGSVKWHHLTVIVTYCSYRAMSFSYFHPNISTDLKIDELLQDLGWVRCSQGNMPKVLETFGSPTDNACDNPLAGECSVETHWKRRKGTCDVNGTGATIILPTWVKLGVVLG